jgi:DNA mismatch repair protein MutL
VNVHPAKREVKLTFESEIYGFLVNAVKKSLQKTAALPVEMTVDVQQHVYQPSTPIFSGGQATPPFASYERNVAQLYRPLPPMELTGQTAFLGLKEQKLFAVGQARNTFILAHSQDGLMIIDQHAAQEKVLYERLLSNLKTTEPSIQMLLVPFSWEVAQVYVELVKDHVRLLQGMGFLVEHFGGNSFLVKGYPSILGEKFDLSQLLEGLVDTFDEPSDRKGGHERNFEHKLAAMTACKAAVKAGDALDLKSCQYILEGLVACDAPLTCPHGRPTIIRLSYSELERRFRRT